MPPKPRSVVIWGRMCTHRQIKRYRSATQLGSMCSKIFFVLMRPENLDLRLYAELLLEKIRRHSGCFPTGFLAEAIK